MFNLLNILVDELLASSSRIIMSLASLGAGFPLVCKTITRCKKESRSERKNVSLADVTTIAVVSEHAIRNFG
jgi:hypothetical protein